MALAYVGAAEYKKDIAELLKSKNEYDRSGAAHALARLKEIEYAPEIAALLRKTDLGPWRDQSPIVALIDLGVGAKYTKEIAQALSNDFSSEVQETAAYALAHLRAREYAPQIANLLNEKYRRSSAAKALAIMGAKEYEPKIAGILDDDNDLHQSAAMLALGILGSREYADKIANLMKTKKESFVSNAVSLLLMNSTAHAKDASEVLKKNKSGTWTRESFITWSGMKPNRLMVELSKRSQN